MLHQAREDVSVSVGGGGGGGSYDIPAGTRVFVKVWAIGGAGGATAPRRLRQGRLAASGRPHARAPAPCLYTALGREGRRCR
ncbi:hypothetical protein U9M48_007463 [Paspalum notatum var. saurae]|uniref:Uncharacterized protein n=1 Tax=Paspalum notatum var. saurae TaxID=547442 RepID=A0AAQ3SL58_PASNO